jgi:Xaa-Pro aminopeptidase
MNNFLKEKGLEAILVSNPANILYQIGNYGFSEKERECFILILRNKKYIITDKRYSEGLKKRIKNYEVLDLGAINFITNDYSNILKKLRMKKLGIEKANLTVFEFENLKKHGFNFIDFDFSDKRKFKDKEEIQNIKRACSVGDLAFEFIINEIKIGVSEIEIVRLLESYIKSKKCELSFQPIVAFGKNSAIPHHLSSNTKLINNQIILIDFGVKINDYCSDMTRTIYFGKAPEKFKNMYLSTLRAQQAAIKYLKDNLKNNKQIKASEVDKISRDFLTSRGFPNLIHALGHGIGIEVHEKPVLSPTSEDLIQNGMVFSVEPGIYFPNYGGVRIEDLVLVRDGFAELISKAKRGIIEIDDK